MPVVGILEGEFVEIKQCVNHEYFQAVFKFPQEVFGQVFNVEQMNKPKLTNILCETKTQSQLFDLKPGQKYKLQCSFGVR